MDDRDGALPLEPGPSPPHEPAVNAPWPPLALAAALLAIYAAQAFSGEGDALAQAYGLAPAELARGHWTGAVTALFVHGGWPHVALNALGAVAFGVPVARLFGPGVRAAAAYFGFFLVCGALSSLGWALIHWGQADVLVGASGAVAGFMGGASRLIEGRGRIAPLASRTVISMGLSWVVVNVVVGLVGLGGVAGGHPIAWEAHLVGYAAGLLLMGPIARALGRL